MACEILLLRHAQSEGNLLGQFIGHTDVNITDLGFRQAQAVKEFLKGVKIDAVYSSDLKRALQTVKPTADDHGLSIITDADLREIWGGDWEGVPFDKIPELFPEDQKKWFADPIDSAPTNGESIRQIYTRVERFMNKLVKKEDGKRVLLTSHATTLRVLECFLRGGLENWEKLPYVSNASITTYRYEDGKYTLLEHNVDYFMGDMVTKLPSNI